MNWLVAVQAVAIVAVVAILDYARRSAERARASAASEAADNLARALRAEAALDACEADRVRDRPRAPAVVSPEARTALRRTVPCGHCGGWHLRACPRLKRIRYRPDGATPLEAEYWQDWTDEDVVWPESVYEEGEA